MIAVSLQVAVLLSVARSFSHASRLDGISSSNDLLQREPTTSPTAAPGCIPVGGLNVGDGMCDDDYNTRECDYDGGDCCPDTCTDGQHTCGGYTCQDPGSIYRRAPLKFRAVFRHTACQYAKLTVFRGAFYYDGLPTCVGFSGREYGVCPFHHLECPGGATYGTKNETRDAILLAIAQPNNLYPGFEGGCSNEQFCSFQKYTCMNRKCVGLERMCDGTDDCEDGSPSDEDDVVSRNLCTAPPEEIAPPPPGIDITSPVSDDLLSETLISADDLFINVSRVHTTGHGRCAGIFSDGFGLGGGALGFSEGVILSSGKAGNVAGPNVRNNTGFDYGRPGDAFLSGLIGGAETHDACVLEIDFSCPEGMERARVDYVFASDEYNEYVHTAYNDVFGFSLNGANIALIPHSGGLPVSINNVNCAANSSNCDLFIANGVEEGYPVNLEADGLTTVLTASVNVEPGLNTMRFAIADVSDGFYDSWVFLKANTFQCDIAVPDIVDPNCQGVDFVGAENLPQYWKDIADQLGVDKTNLGFNTDAEVWCYNGHDTCIKWDEWDSTCDADVYACAGAYMQPATSGCGPSQMHYISDMISMGETQHYECPVCEDAPSSQVKMCKDGQEYLFASGAPIGPEYVEPASSDHELARWTACDCAESYTGIDLKTNGYWWNEAFLAGVDPALVSHRADKWYYDGTATCVAKGNQHGSACDSAQLVCAGGASVGYAVEQMTAVKVASQNGNTHPGCPGAVPP